MMNSNAVILNMGSGAWAFELHAEHLNRVLGVPVSEEPAQWNYLLGWDEATPPQGNCFIPFEAIEAATDKRALARLFASHGVPTPETYLVDSGSELQTFLQRYQSREWLLKWPSGCGATGHRFVQAGDAIPNDWPLPFVVQEFVRVEKPEVYRLYGVAGELFGWNVRRFEGEVTSPFVAHARGANYAIDGVAPPEAIEAAYQALEATNLLSSFGCADLLRDKRGKWLVLEVNTDGRWMHVDRDVPPVIAQEIDRRLKEAFRRWCQSGAE